MKFLGRYALVAVDEGPADAERRVGDRREMADGGQGVASVLTLVAGGSAAAAAQAKVATSKAKTMFHVIPPIRQASKFSCMMQAISLEWSHVTHLERRPLFQRHETDGRRADGVGAEHRAGQKPRVGEPTGRAAGHCRAQAGAALDAERRAAAAPIVGHPADSVARAGRPRQGDRQSGRRSLVFRRAHEVRPRGARSADAIRTKAICDVRGRLGRERGADAGAFVRKTREVQGGSFPALAATDGPRRGKASRGPSDSGAAAQP